MKTKQMTFMLTQEEEQELSEYIKHKIVSTGSNVTKSDIFREAIFKYIRNGKPDNKQESVSPPAITTTEIDPKTPTEENPFADLNLD